MALATVAHRGGVLLASGLGAALGVAPLRTSALGLGAAALALLALSFPAYALGVLAFTVPFGEALRLPLGDLSLTATEPALALLAAGWLARSALAQHLDIGAPALWIPLGVFLGVLVLSATTAASLAPAAKEVIKWLEFGVAFALAASLLSVRRAAVALAVALLVAGLSEALYGLSQSATGAGPAGFRLAGLVRAYGTFGQPNPFAAYLAMLLVLTTALGLALGVRRVLCSPLGLLLLLAAGVMLLAMAASLSRGALLALAAGALVVLAAHSRRGLLGVGLAALLGVALLLLGASGLLPEVVAGRFAPLLENFSVFDARSVILTSENFALVQRMAIWQAAWEMFLDHPFLGVGPGNFDVAYPAYALPGWGQAPGHAHNFYLNLLAETGFLGLSSYVALLAYLAWQAARSVRGARPGDSHDLGDRFSYGLALGGLGLLGVLTAHHLFDNLYVHAMGVQVGLILGAAAAVRPGRWFVGLR